MAKKLLESAFIDVMDVDDEIFQQRSLFFVRWAVHIEKRIGVKKGTRVVTLVEFADNRVVVPDSTIAVKAVFVGNPFTLTTEEYRDFDLVKSICSNYKSLRFVEQQDQLLIGHDITQATLVLDILERDEFGRNIVEEDHIPAITAYIKYKIIEKEKMKAALKGEQKYYMLSREKMELDQDYNRMIIDARSNERFKETEEVIEPNQITNADDYLDFSFEGN